MRKAQMDSHTLKVSYKVLLDELARRRQSGSKPAEDQEYFADLMFNLLFNQQSVERSIAGRRKSDCPA
jgi:hypothetical protein